MAFILVQRKFIDGFGFDADILVFICLFIGILALSEQSGETLSGIIINAFPKCLYIYLSKRFILKYKDDYLDININNGKIVRKILLKTTVAMLIGFGIIFRMVNAEYISLDILGTIQNIQLLLMQIGPAFSAMLFVLGGIFYAVGQLFPSYKRASLHTMAIDIIIGAVVVAVLSVASTNLAIASTHILSNFTSNTL